MLSFERQARGRWPCTAALGTAQSRLMWNRARPAMDRPQRTPVCGSGQAACIRPVPGGAAGRREPRHHPSGPAGRRRTAAAVVRRYMRRRALPSESNRPAGRSGMAGVLGAEPQRLHQRGDCSKKYSVISSTHVHPHPPLAAAPAAPPGESWAGAGGWGRAAAAAAGPVGVGLGGAVAIAIGRGVCLFMASRGYSCGWPAGSGAAWHAPLGRNPGCALGAWAL